MHTDYTVDLLDKATIELGKSFRDFIKNTCSAFDTRELKKEVEAQKHRLDAKEDTASSQVKPKSLNITTYKFHALGDYVAAIKRYGTSDSYSTEIVSCLFLCEKQSTQILY